MKGSVRRGLEVAIGVLAVDGAVGELPVARLPDVVEAIAWIEHQIEIDDRRRKPRGKYRR